MIGLGRGWMGRGLNIFDDFFLHVSIPCINQNRPMYCFCLAPSVWIIVDVCMARLYVMTRGDDRYWLGKMSFPYSLAYRSCGWGSYIQQRWVTVSYMSETILCLQWRNFVISADGQLGIINKKWLLMFWSSLESVQFFLLQPFW